jgi:RNA recognition motif-containing protein
MHYVLQVNLFVLDVTSCLLMFHRSPLNPSDDRNDEDSNLSGGKDRSRERERDRSRRGDRPSRFGPRSSSHSRERERERDRERDRGGKKSSAERRIFVSNIAYEFRWQELKDLFRTEGSFFIGLSHILV